VTRNRSLPRLALIAVVLSAVVLAACGGDSKASSNSSSSTSASSSPSVPAGTRPTTPATLTIVDPKADQQEPANFTAKFDLTGATFAKETSTNITPDQGFIHVSVDDRQVAIVDTTDVPLYALAPGPHTLSGEYVASDHVPFANRTIASVSFTVA
jgi:hypothetical protein